MRNNWKSVKYSKIKIHVKYSRSEENNTKSLTICCVKHLLDHSVSNHVRCFESSVEYLQYTLADFFLVIVDCHDSCLPS